MFKGAKSTKNEGKGLTLIELLVTIAVIAIVAAISIPVITNVIDSARTSSAESQQAMLSDFIDKYDEAGDWTYDAASQTFTALVDLDGDGNFATGQEVIETFTVDETQFAVFEAAGSYHVAEYVLTENAYHPISAPSGEAFSGAFARYQSTSTTCGADVSNLVSGMVTGQNAVSLEVSNSPFGDPCPSELKELVVRFTYSD
jgi:prepilin-type N-terminal cleavage/methylation domain-containing protein